MAEKKERRKVKYGFSWFSLYLVFLALVFVRVLVVTIEIVSHPEFNFEFINMLAIFGNIIIMVMAYKSFTSILSEDKSAIKKNKLFLKIWLGVTIFLSLVGLSVGISRNYNLLELLYRILILDGLIFVIAIGIVWLKYWDTSIRVKKTFGETSKIKATNLKNKSDKSN